MSFLDATFSTAPITMQQTIWLQRAGKGDVESICELLIARSTLARPDVMAMQIDQLELLMPKLLKSITDGQNFRGLVDGAQGGKVL